MTRLPVRAWWASTHATGHRAKALYPRAAMVWRIPTLTRSTLGALGCLTGCGDIDTGVVELNWAFVDRDGDAIFPAGQFSIGRGDSCGLPARSATQRVDVDLAVELDICDPACEGDCTEDCKIVPSTRANCVDARRTLQSVPASDDPYLFFFRAVIETPTSECVDPPPSCIATPGPRERHVLRGLVTDLQVIQLVVDIDLDISGANALDLEACGCA